MSEQSEIIIRCSLCQGYGTIERSEIEDHHRGEYREWDEICNLCEGSGRILKTTTISYKPYHNPKIAEIAFKKLKE